MCRVKCLRELSWNGTFRDGSMFTWIGNVFRLPQDIVDIPRTWHVVRFVRIIVLFEVMEAGFLTLTVPPGQQNESSRFAVCLPKTMT